MELKLTNKESMMIMDAMLAYCNVEAEALFERFSEGDYTKSQLLMFDRELVTRIIYAEEQMADTVTITITQNEAEWWAMHRSMADQGNFFERQIQAACQAALEEKK